MLNSVHHDGYNLLTIVRIGIVPMSAKPFHVGHDLLVRLASRECDVVHLYVSTSDRGNVSGGAMAKIWRENIEPTLPDNVEVKYGGSPVNKAYQELGAASEASSEDDYLVYSDTTDAANNFSEASFQKYAPNLFNAGHVKTRPVDRTSTVDISGTKMRSFLTDGDKESFMKYMPAGVDGEAIWNTLRSMEPAQKIRGGKNASLKRGVKGEALLRSFIRSILRG